MTIFKYFLASFIVIVCALICYAQEKTIAFTDNSTLDVTNAQKNAGDLSRKAVIKISRKDFVAVLNSIGKALKPLNLETLGKLSKINRPLALKIKNIHSAYQISQENTGFYFAAFNTVDFDNFRMCDSQAACRVKCQAIVLTVNDKGVKENIVIITAMRKIK